MQIFTDIHIMGKTDTIYANVKLTVRRDANTCIRCSIALTHTDTHMHTCTHTRTRTHTHNLMTYP